jgi:hypothetical protein
VVAWVLSTSSTAPHLFGDRVDDFIRDLRSLLLDVSPEGRFSGAIRQQTPHSQTVLIHQDTGASGIQLLPIALTLRSAVRPGTELVSNGTNVPCEN